jgi:hypothetical protein
VPGPQFSSVVAVKLKANTLSVFLLLVSRVKSPPREEVRVRLIQIPQCLCEDAGITGGEPCEPRLFLQLRQQPAESEMRNRQAVTEHRGQFGI